MKTFAIKTRFIFTGIFFVAAESKEQAAEYVNKHCGLVIGGNIHSTLPANEVDWDFPVHPDTEIGRISITKGGNSERNQF
ncbi:hypothetical protein FACS1894137_03660 [Spirochaetia bacterium]|nr:hypothetical protein FACS1894137_03660 [Spirochaetia bacterium]